MASNLGRQVGAAVQAAGRAGLRRVAEEVLAIAERNAPKGDAAVDPDPNVTLARAGRIVEDEDGFVVIFAAPYAAKQHEDVNLKHPRGGESKYLESALTSVVPRTEGVVAGEVLAHMKRDPTQHRRSGTSILQRTVRTT